MFAIFAMLFVLAGLIFVWLTDTIEINLRKYNKKERDVMKIFVEFNPETKECEVRYEVDKEDTMPIWDVMPYVHDALYDLNKKEMKKNMLR